MDTLYKFPETAKFEKIIPKSKVYAHANPGSKVKQAFVRDVEKIVWSFKLSPETINIDDNENVNEIQIITIYLKTGVISDEVLLAIDKSVPSPVIFVLEYEGRIKYQAAYKRINQADRNKWVVGPYFESGWLPADSQTNPLPIALNMEVLYEALLKSIINILWRDNETMGEYVLRLETIRIKEREAQQLEARVNKEKQFNRKMELNAQLNRLKKEVYTLKR